MTSQPAARILKKFFVGINQEVKRIEHVFLLQNSSKFMEAFKCSHFYGLKLFKRFLISSSQSQFSVYRNNDIFTQMFKCRKPSKPCHVV